MDRASGEKQTIARARLELVQAVRYGPPGQCGAELPLIDPGLKASVDPAVWSGGQDEPGLCLPSLLWTQVSRSDIIRVDLDGHPVTDIQELDEPRKGPREPGVSTGRRTDRAGGAEQGGSVALEQVVEGGTGQRAVPDGASVGSVIADFPGFVVGSLGRQD
jgi:hypothetical protein